MLSRWWRLVPVLVLLILPACSNDDDNGVNPHTPFPATIPSTQTMRLDVSDLASSTGPARPAGVCHSLTALVVGWLNLNVAARLVVPEAVLAACLQQPSVYLGDSHWQWTVTGGQGSGTWTAVLTAQVGVHDQDPVDRVAWDLTVSGTPLSFDHALFFDGHCDPTAHEGEWIFYNPQSTGTPVAVIRCRWSLPQEPGAAWTLAFHGVDPVSTIYGDDLAYALSDSSASIAYRDSSEAKTVAARWDLRDGSGRAFGAEGDSCCWGPRAQLYPDVECP